MRPLNELDDQECIALALDGNGKAFPALVKRYQDRIYRFILRLIRSPDEASDLTQDTFLRAYQGLARWRPDASFKTWLFRIARNAAFDHLRRVKRVEFVALEDDMEIPDPAAGPEAVLETAQRVRILAAALGRLPQDHREILLLREIEDMSYEEIADVLGLNTGTVKSRIARARAALLDGVQRRMEKS